MAINSRGHIEKMLHFMGLKLEPEVETFIKEHTKQTAAKANWNTFRNTKDIPDQWRKGLIEAEIRTIESQCFQAMRIWDYKPSLEKDTSKSLH